MFGEVLEDWFQNAVQAKILKNGNPSTDEDTENCMLPEKMYAFLSTVWQYPSEALETCLFFEPVIPLHGIYYK